MEIVGFPYIKRKYPNKSKEIQICISDSGCHEIFTHAPNQDGYIRLYLGEGPGRLKMAHRIVWEYHNGPVPSGHEIDHKCRNRKCCNLSHLQLLGISEHKSKTNKERYKHIIDEGKKLLLLGLTVHQVADEMNVELPRVKYWHKQLGEQQ